MGTGPARLEALLRRDRAIVLAGLAALTLLAWGHLVRQARTMGAMGAMTAAPGMAMPRAPGWGAAELLALFAMWSVMMVAMMVPSAAPLVLLFARADRRGDDRRAAGAAALLAGYLLAWIGFSALAALAQWALHRAALLSPAMAAVTPRLAGAILAAAGIFQLTPLKRACLTRCRSPVAFLAAEWRGGAWRGAMRLGARHGAYCVGCCWALMALLFAAGVMNLLWVAAIAAFVLVERVAPRGDAIGRLAGAAMLVSGIALVLR